MLINVSPIYTISDFNHKRENPIVGKLFMESARNISNYSHTQMTITTGYSSTTDCSDMSKKIKPAPEKLKRAMFKTSSRGIAIALKKK